MHKKFKNLNRGISTLEILLAFAILILMITAVLQLGFGSQSLSVDQQTNEEAIIKAHALIEEARSLSILDFNSLETQTTVKDDIYTKNLIVTADPNDPTNTDKRLVTARVEWPLIGGRNPYIEFSTLLTNFLNPGSKCKQIISGDWTKPQVYAYVDFPSASGATSIDVENNKMYITSNPSASVSDDFYVVDIDGMTPGQGSLPILSHLSTSYGLTDVDTSGNYSYVSAASASFQLLVIDITNPSSLGINKIVSKKDVTPASDTAIGNTILYFNKKVYLGLTKSAGKEFHIFDVSSPTNPVEIGSGFEVDAAVNQITFRNNIVYLATASSSEIIALDVSQPTNIKKIGTYNSVTLTGQSLAINPSNTLLFGRIGGNGNPKLLAFNVNNLSSPKWTMNMSSQSGIYTMQMRGNLLFMTTADPNDGLQIWDISKSPPVRYDTTPLNIQQTATAGSDCVGNLLYVAQRSQRAIQIIGPHIYDTYSLSSDGDKIIEQGKSDTVTITKKLESGTPISESISVGNLPSGVTTNITNGNCTPDCTSTIKLIVASSTLVGKTLITVNTPSGVSTSFNLEITAAPFDYSLTNNGNINIKQGSQGGVSVNANLLSGNSKPITLSVSSNPVLPGSVTYALSSSLCTPNCTSTLTINAANDPSTKNKTYTLTVTGSPGDFGSRITSFDITIKP